MIFQDRSDAGKKLSSLLKINQSEFENPIIIALPRGGVIVGYEIAKDFNIPLDIIGVRKLGAPQNPEFGIGAIAEEGIYFVNKEAVSFLRISPEKLNEIREMELKEIQRRLTKFRGNKPPTIVKDRTVLLVDDGIATGVTAIVGAKLLKKRGAKKIILSVPICAGQTADEIKSEHKEIDNIICVEMSYNMNAVGNWYENFNQTSDEEVIELLKKFV